MSLVYDLTVLLHLLSMAALVGGYLVVLRRPRPLPLMAWGARLLVLSGLVIVALGEAADVWAGQDPNHMKIGIKLAVAVVALVLIEVAGGRSRRKGEEAARGLVHTAGGLAVANVLVAVLIPGFM